MSVGCFAVTLLFEVKYTLHRDCIVIDMFQLCALNCISIHKIVFSHTRFGAFPAPSPGTLKDSVHTQYTHEWFVTLRHAAFT